MGTDLNAGYGRELSRVLGGFLTPTEAEAASLSADGDGWKRRHAVKLYLSERYGRPITEDEHDAVRSTWFGPAATDEEAYATVRGLHPEAATWNLIPGDRPKAPEGQPSVLERALGSLTWMGPGWLALESTGAVDLADKAVSAAVGKVGRSNLAGEELPGEWGWVPYWERQFGTSILRSLNQTMYSGASFVAARLKMARTAKALGEVGRQVASGLEMPREEQAALRKLSGQPLAQLTDATWWADTGGQAVANALAFWVPQAAAIQGLEALGVANPLLKAGLAGGATGVLDAVVEAGSLGDSVAPQKDAIRQQMAEVDGYLQGLPSNQATGLKAAALVQAKREYEDQLRRLDNRELAGRFAGEVFRRNLVLNSVENALSLGLGAKAVGLFMGRRVGSVLGAAGLVTLDQVLEQEQEQYQNEISNTAMAGWVTGRAAALDLMPGKTLRAFLSGDAEGMDTAMAVLLQSGHSVVVNAVGQWAALRTMAEQEAYRKSLLDAARKAQREGNPYGAALLKALDTKDAKTPGPAGLAAFGTRLVALGRTVVSRTHEAMEATAPEAAGRIDPDEAAFGRTREEAEETAGQLAEDMEAAEAAGPEVVTGGAQEAQEGGQARPAAEAGLATAPQGKPVAGPDGELAQRTRTDTDGHGPAAPGATEPMVRVPDPLVPPAAPVASAAVQWPPPVVDTSGATDAAPAVPAAPIAAAEPAAGPEPVTTARGMTQALSEANPDARPMEVIGAAEIPAAVHAQNPSGRPIQAYWKPDGMLVLVADNVPAGMGLERFVQRKYAHEQTHEGLERLRQFDRAGFEAWMDYVQRSISPEALVGLLGKTTLSPDQVAANPALALRMSAAEYLAGLAEKVSESGRESLNDTQKGLWESAVAKVREWVRAMMARARLPVRLTDQDLEELTIRLLRLAGVERLRAEAAGQAAGKAATQAVEGQAAAPGPGKPAERARRPVQVPRQDMPVLGFVSANGGIVPKRLAGNVGGEYDGAVSPTEMVPFSGAVYAKDAGRGLSPDQAAAMMADRGLIRDAYPDTMWEALRGEVKAYRMARKAAKEQARMEKEAAAKARTPEGRVEQAKDAVEGNPEVPVVAAELKTGDQVQHDGDWFVAEVDDLGGTVTLKDGTDIVLDTFDQIAVAGGMAVDADGNVRQVGAQDPEQAADEEVAFSLGDEVAAVRGKYEGTPGWMKAPNGEPTRLTEEQWLAARTPGFLEHAGDWMARPLAMPVRSAATFSEARDVLNGIRGGRFPNVSLRILGRISRDSVDKLVSGKAVGKSVGNGFSVAEHLVAAANIDRLFMNGVEVGSEPHRSGDPRILRVIRMGAPIILGRGTAEALLTVNEYADAAGRVYSLEMLEIEEPADTSGRDRGVPSGGTPTAGYRANLAAKFRAVNGVGVSVTLDANGEPSASAVNEYLGRSEGEVVFSLGEAPAGTGPASAGPRLATRAERDEAEALGRKAGATAERQVLREELEAVGLVAERGRGRRDLEAASAKLARGAGYRDMLARRLEAWYELKFDELSGTWGYRYPREGERGNARANGMVPRTRQEWEERRRELTGWDRQDQADAAQRLMDRYDAGGEITAEDLDQSGLREPAYLFSLGDAPELSARERVLAAAVAGMALRGRPVGARWVGNRLAEIGQRADHAGEILAHGQALAERLRAERLEAATDPELLAALTEQVLRDRYRGNVERTAGTAAEQQRAMEDAWRRLAGWKQDHLRRLAEKRAGLSDGDLEAAGLPGLTERLRVVVSDFAPKPARKRPAAAEPGANGPAQPTGDQETPPERDAEDFDAAASERDEAAALAPLPAQLPPDPIAVAELKQTIRDAAAKKLAGEGHKPKTPNTDPVLRAEVARTWARLLRETAWAYVKPGARREWLLEACRALELAPPTLAGIDRRVSQLAYWVSRAADATEVEGLLRKVDRLLKLKAVKGPSSQTEELIRRRMEPHARAWLRLVKDVYRLSEEQREAYLDAAEALAERVDNGQADDGVARTQLVGMAPSLGTEAIWQGLPTGDLIEGLSRALSMYGALPARTPAEVAAAYDQLRADYETGVQRIAEAREARRERLTPGREALVAAWRRLPEVGKDTLAAWAGQFARRGFSFYNGMLDLGRYAKGAEHAALTRTVEGLSIQIQAAHDDHSRRIAASRQALEDAVRRIYRTDDVEGVLRALEEPQEAFRRFSRNKEREQALSRANLVFIVAALEQEQYRRTAHDHGRGGDYVADVRAALSAEDLALLDWLREWYRQNRDELSAKSLEVLGVPVLDPDPLYHPVRVKRPGSGLAEWHYSLQLAPTTFEQRRRHQWDIDETASAVGLFHLYAEANARFLSHVELAQDLRYLFGHPETRTVLEEFAGKEEAGTVVRHVTEIASGKGMGQDDGSVEALARLRGATTLAMMSWNVGAGARQLSAIPAFALHLGPTGMVKAMAREMLNPAEWAATIAEMRQDAAFRAWASHGYSEPVDNALRRASRGRLARLMRLGMVVQSWGIQAAVFAVAPGHYAGRRDAWLAQGYSPEAARKQAMAETLWLVNQTQGSSDVAMLSPMWRGIGEPGRFLMQFTGPVAQLYEWEARAVREVWAGTPGSWRRLRNTVMINHVAIPVLYMVVKALWEAVRGDWKEDPEDEGWQTVRETLGMIAMGPVGGVVLLGSGAEAAVRVAAGLQVGASEIPAVALLSRTVGGSLNLAKDLATLDWEQAWKDWDRVMSAVSAPWRDASKAVKNWSDQ